MHKHTNTGPRSSRKVAHMACPRRYCALYSKSLSRRITITVIPSDVIGQGLNGDGGGKTGKKNFENINNGPRFFPQSCAFPLGKKNAVKA